MTHSITVLLLALFFVIPTCASELSVTQHGDTTTIWDVNIARGCVGTVFQMTSWSSHDTLYIVEQDTLPLTTCGVCYYTLSSTFIGLAPGTYYAVVMHDFAITPWQDTVTTAGILAFTIGTPPLAFSEMSFSQTGCRPTLWAGVARKTQPSTYAMLSNYPNPFNPSTNIRYDIPHATHVLLELYTVTGQRVAELVNEFRQAGVYDYPFANTNLASGMYVCRLHYGERHLSTKLAIVK